MKNFRIKPENRLKIELVLNRSNILQPLYIQGFKNLPSIVSHVKNQLDWSIKGKGKRIEIGILNLDNNQIKYIDTFS